MSSMKVTTSASIPRSRYVPVDAIAHRLTGLMHHSKAGVCNASRRERSRDVFVQLSRALRSAEDEDAPSPRLEALGIGESESRMLDELVSNGVSGENGLVLSEYALGLLERDVRAVDEAGEDPVGHADVRVLLEDGTRTP